MKESSMHRADFISAVFLIAFGVATVALSLKMPTFAEMKASEEKAQQDFFASINQLEFTDEGYPCKLPVFYRKQAGILGIFPARTRGLSRLSSMNWPPRTTTSRHRILVMSAIFAESMLK